MNKSDYMKLLGTALIGRGIPEEAAIRHVKILSIPVTEKELASKSDDEILLEVDRLAENVVKLLKEDDSAETSPSPSPEKQKKTPENPLSEASDQNNAAAGQKVPVTSQNNPVSAAKNKSTDQKEQVSLQTEKKVLPEYVSPDSVVPVDFEKEDMPRGDDYNELVGKTKIKIVREEKPIKPTSGAIAAGHAKIAFLMILRVLMEVLRIVLMVLLVALTIAGVALFFIGIANAIRLLGSFREAGIFEFGLSIIIGGVILILGVVVYNCVGNFIPRCQRLLRRKIKSLKKRIREASHKMKIKRRRAS